MARTQQVTVRETISVRRIADASEDFMGDQVPLIPSLDVAWGSGTGDNQSDLVAADVGLSIAAGATESLDLAALAKGPEGSTVAFAEIRAILIRTPTTNGSTVTLSPNATNGWTGLGAALEIEVPAGAYMRLYTPVDGSAPVSASDKVLDITNDDGAAAATVDICIIGTSA